MPNLGKDCGSARYEYIGVPHTESVATRALRACYCSVTHTKMACVAQQVLAKRDLYTLLGSEGAI